MPLDAPVTTATLLGNLLIFTIVLYRCELRLAGIKISIYFISTVSVRIVMAAAGAMLIAMFSHAADKSGLSVM
jgi:hypothetical protein